jgi:hypothetical protein
MLIFFLFVLDRFLSTGECSHDILTFSKSVSKQITFPLVFFDPHDAPRRFSKHSFFLFFVSKQITNPLVFFDSVIAKYSKTSPKKQYFVDWKTKKAILGGWKKTENIFIFLKLFFNFRKWTKINVHFSFLKKSFKSFFPGFFRFLF